MNYTYLRVLLPRQKGMTIVEMMIALTIGLIVLGGLLTVYNGTKQSYRMQQAQSRLQENGNFAVEFLVRDLRMGGYQGCPNVDGITSADISASVGGSTVAISMAANKVLRGYNVTDTSGGMTPTYGGPGATPTSTVSGTDAISLAFGGCEAKLSADMGSATTATVVANTCDFAESDIMIISDCARSEMFQAASGTSSASVVTGGPAQYKIGSRVLKLIFRDYFINEKTLINGLKVPGLYRRDLVGTGAVELIEGVQDMKVLYGVKNGLNGTVSYVAATSVTDWGQVTSLRVSLLLQTVDDNIVQQPYTYTYNGTTSTGTDRRMRQAFSTTVNLRNRGMN